MGLLSNKDWNDAYRRTLGKSTKRCSIAEVRELAGKPRDDGAPAMDTTFIGLRLEEDAKCEDGSIMAAGAVIEVGLNTIADPQEDKHRTMNRISQERFRELVVAALALPPGAKDAAGELEKAGGAEALKGRQVVVDFASSTKGQNVNKFAAVPKAAV